MMCILSFPSVAPSAFVGVRRMDFQAYFQARYVATCSIPYSAWVRFAVRLESRLIYKVVLPLLSFHGFHSRHSTLQSIHTNKSRKEEKPKTTSITTLPPKLYLTSQSNLNGPLVSQRGVAPLKKNLKAILTHTYLRLQKNTTLSSNSRCLPIFETRLYSSPSLHRAPNPSTQSLLNHHRRSKR